MTNILSYQNNHLKVVISFQFYFHKIGNFLVRNTFSNDFFRIANFWRFATKKIPSLLKPVSIYQGRQSVFFLILKSPKPHHHTFCSWYNWNPSIVRGWFCNVESYCIGVTKIWIFFIENSTKSMEIRVHS